MGELSLDIGEYKLCHYNATKFLWRSELNLVFEMSPFGWLKGE